MHSALSRNAEYLISKRCKKSVELFHTHLNGILATLDTTERNVVSPVDYAPKLRKTWFPTKKKKIDGPSTWESQRCPTTHHLLHSLASESQAEPVGGATRDKLGARSQ